MIAIETGSTLERHGGRRLGSIVVARVLPLALLVFGTAGCEATGSGSGTGSGPSATSSEPSKCWVCNGRGEKRDPNSGKMGMCEYCNGRGVK